MKALKKKMIAIPAGSNPTSDSMALLLNWLMVRTVTHSDYRKGYYIPLDSFELRRVCGTDYCTVIEDASQLGLVERNHKYSTGGDGQRSEPFSKGCRLTEAFRTGSWEKYILKRARTIVTDRKKKGRGKMRFGVVAALLKALSKVKSADPDLPLNNQDRMLMFSIDNGDIYASRCAFGHRLHTTFTGISKEGRLNLRTAMGETLCEVDVRNSQPLLLYALITSSMSSSEKVQFETQYLEWCQSGELYDHILDEHVRSGPDAGLSRTMTRDEVKKNVIKLLFQKNTNMPQNPLYPTVNNMFPLLIACVMELKVNDHRDLSRKLQRLESKIMIDGVARSILKGNPNIPLATVHDSILCTEGMTEDVAKEIRKHFMKHGVEPSIKISKKGVSRTAPLPISTGQSTNASERQGDHPGLYVVHVGSECA